MSNSLAYLACPYSHPDPEVRNTRFHVSNKAAGRLMASGLFVFSPISMSHPISKDANVPGDWAYWGSFDRAMIARCQRFIVIAIDGLNESVGVRAEIAIARELGLHIEYAIPLTKGYFALVDEEDFEAVSEFKWCAAVRRNCVYAVRNLKTSEGHIKQQLMHKFLVPGEEIDHKDGNGWNNRRHNLRPCTHRQNLQAARSKKKRGSSSFRGVCWNKALNKWQTNLSLNGKTLFLGLFVDETDAARAYDIAARKYFGEFASPNFL